MIGDAMDQMKCHVPHFLHSFKAWDEAEKVRMQFGAVIMHGVGTRMFAWDKELGKDSNLWATLFLRCFTDECDRRAKDIDDKTGKPVLPPPEVVYIQCDNAGDNKNKQLFRLAEMLVKTGAARKVKISFLPVGHTHEDVDACFGAGSHVLCRHDAYTMEDVLALWKRAWPSTKSFDYVSVS